MAAAADGGTAESETSFERQKEDRKEEKEGRKKEKADLEAFEERLEREGAPKKWEGRSGHGHACVRSDFFEGACEIACSVKKGTKGK